MSTADFSPITKVEWDTPGNNFAAPTDIGELSDESTNEPELFEDNKNTRGEIMYAGTSDIYDIKVFTEPTRQALFDKFRNDERVDFRLTRSDGSSFQILEVKPVVSELQGNQFQPGNRRFWNLNITKIKL